MILAEITEPLSAINLLHFLDFYYPLFPISASVNFYLSDTKLVGISVRNISLALVSYKYKLLSNFWLNCNLHISYLSTSFGHIGNTKQNILCMIQQQHTLCNPTKCGLGRVECSVYTDPTPTRKRNILCMIQLIYSFCTLKNSLLPPADLFLRHYFQFFMKPLYCT